MVDLGTTSLRHNRDRIAEKMEVFVRNEADIRARLNRAIWKVDGIEVSKCTQFVCNWNGESAPGAMVCARRCAMVCGCWLPADAQSPVWLQLRTGYILSSGSLSTVPKRESDDYSTERTREGERGEREKRGRLIPVRRHAYALEERTSSVVFFIRPSYSFWCTNELFLVTFIFHFLFRYTRPAQRLCETG